MASKKLLTVLVLLLVPLLSNITATYAQNQGKPLDLPVALLPGPSTWLLGQPYGNTTGAFARGDVWYSAGQRLHFGIDLSMPCGTPLVAVADAEVVGVDDLSFGSAPHNLLLRHADLGLTTLYGHLLERPPLVNGQFVQRGQIVALSGDPDGTCDSRPHLHLEIRSLDYRTAYNPVEYINAAWHSLSAIGSFSSQNFQRDLDNARRWLTLSDQPDVAFGGRALNNYAASWPAPEQPPANPPLARTLDPLPADQPWQLRRLAYQGCCFWPWWDPTDASRLYAIDGSEGQRAGIYEWIIGEVDAFNLVGQAPPAFTSPDATHEIRLVNEQAVIRRLADGAEWTAPTNGRLPALNPTNTRLMWLQREGVQIPGQEPPPLEIWVSNLDGQNASLLVSQRGGSAQWLDADRLLVTSSERQATTISVYNVTDNTSYTLGTWERLRGLSVAPGGGRIMFYLTYNTDVAANGVYALDLQPGATPVKLPWFGSWRWRDADSVFYLPFEPTTNQQTLAYYHLATGDNRLLTDPAATPFTVANGDWSVSADGQRIAFLNATDLTTWLIEPVFD